MMIHRCIRYTPEEYLDTHYKQGWRVAYFVIGRRIGPHHTNVQLLCRHVTRKVEGDECHLLAIGS